MIAIFISPIQVSAMSIEDQYRNALIEVIGLLMQQVEELVKQLNELQMQQIPVESQVIIKEIPHEEVEVEYVKPVSRPYYNLPVPTPTKCHAKGQLDVVVKCD